ncbi:hypothetical protein F5Y04DRAFT_277553 [Hypomontagnella monticulosa]|nr:hypothetical protein F5Y04DRAFT_277553 [Hypomontagnella monticulosa]
MSILCCCRGRRTAYEEPGQDALELPIRPPRAKLSKQQLPASEPELSPPLIITTQAPSLLSNQIPEATVDPTILEVEDSDDDEPVRTIRNSSTGTLEAIKTKFNRHLSQKSESKRYSQQSLGTSDEEIARRAELKRLMHKRIQEELKSEEEQDEVEANPGDLDELKSDSSTNVGLRRRGPRDNIEFCVASVNDTGSKDITGSHSDDIFLSIPVSDSQPAISLRRSSYPGSSGRAHGSSISESHEDLKEQGSLAQFPSSPQLAPVHLPSARGSESLCSWRLSYSAEQLANYLEVPEGSKPDSDSGYVKLDAQTDDGEDDKHEIPAESNSLGNQIAVANPDASEDTDQCEPVSSHSRQDSLANEENSENQYSESPNDTNSGNDSPLEIWLRSQLLQSDSTASSRRTSDIMLRMARDITDSEVRSTRSDDVGSSQKSVEKAPDGLSITQHHSSNLQPELRMDAVMDPTKPADLWPNDQSHIVKGSGGPACDLVTNSADRVREVSSSHYASSRQTTRPSSRQATAKGSRLSLIDLLGGRKTMPPFSSFSGLKSPSRTTDAEKSDASSYKTAPNEASTLNLATRETQQLRPPTMDTSSLVISDTASFKQREAELKSIEKRFGRIHLRRDTVTPITSKFREEFNEPKTSSTTRNSIFARLHFPIPRRAKHLAKDTRRYSVHDVNLGTVGNMSIEISHPGRRKPEKSVDRQREAPCSTSQKPRNVDDTISPRREAAASEEDIGAHQEEAASSEQAGSGNDSGMPGLKPMSDHGQTLKPPSRHDDNSSPHSDISSSVLREWVNLMNDQDSDLLAEPRAEPRSRTPRKFRTPPASWARWPSHTRQERTGPAGKEDNVIPKDFAVRADSNDSGMNWSTDKPSDSPKKYVAPISRSLSAQLGRAVKGGLSRVVGGTLNRDTRTSSEAYRSRQKPDGRLEYPELEIIPMQGGYREIQALEQQIDTMKRGSVSAENQLARLPSDSTRTPLSMRLAEEVHKMQHRASKDSCEDEEDEVRTPKAAFPTSPARVFAAPKDISAPANQRGTPASQISYEDCVPKHMLEEERPVDGPIAAKSGHDTRMS